MMMNAMLIIGCGWDALTGLGFFLGGRRTHGDAVGWRVKCTFGAPEGIPAAIDRPRRHRPDRTPQRGTPLPAHGNAVGNTRPHTHTPQRGTQLAAHGNAVGNPYPHTHTPQRGTPLPAHGNAVGNPYPPHTSAPTGHPNAVPNFRAP